MGFSTFSIFTFRITFTSSWLGPHFQLVIVLIPFSSIEHSVDAGKSRCYNEWPTTNYRYWNYRHYPMASNTYFDMIKFFESWWVRNERLCNKMEPWKGVEKDPSVFISSRDSHGIVGQSLGWLLIGIQNRIGAIWVIVIFWWQSTEIRQCEE